jgi:hypothetical protein
MITTTTEPGTQGKGNKCQTDRRDITEILLKVDLITINHSHHWKGWDRTYFVLMKIINIKHHYHL